MGRAEVDLSGLTERDGVVLCLLLDEMEVEGDDEAAVAERAELRELRRRVMAEGDESDDPAEHDAGDDDRREVSGGQSAEELVHRAMLLATATRVMGSATGASAPEDRRREPELRARTSEVVPKQPVRASMPSRPVLPAATSIRTSAPSAPRTGAPTPSRPPPTSPAARSGPPRGPVRSSVAPAASRPVAAPSHAIVSRDQRFPTVEKTRPAAPIASIRPLLTGADLAAFRRRLGATQAVLAAALGVAQGTLSKAEAAAERPLTTALAAALLAAMGRPHDLDIPARIRQE